MQRRSVEFPAPPGRALVIDRLPELADRLHSAIEKLQSWDIRIADLGRLRSAERTLRLTFSQGAYPQSPKLLRDVAEALWISSDFPLIVQAFAPAMSKRIASELQLALKGTLHGTEPSRAAYQFQTQYKFGAALYRGGLGPTIPLIDA